MNDTVQQKYEKWVKCAIADADLCSELGKMADDPVLMEDAFYRDLEFGTGGLRGVIGAGTNRMNVYTVGRASQGLSDYVIKNFPEKERRIAVSFDSRIKSDLFSRVASGVFAANGIKVYIYRQLMPTPCLSFAVRHLDCSAGIMVTASHNPAKYNGYKVYGPDGCQITTRAAEDILGEIEKLDVFSDVKSISFEEGIEKGLIEYISDDVYTQFINNVKAESVLGETVIERNVAIVYSPLNGTGLKPVLRTLEETGFGNVKVVAEQEKPDGNFTTCPYPNPEVREAMALGIQYASTADADLLIATDPDCDRVGIAVKDKNGEYVLISGNETGILLLDFICSMRLKCGTMPEDPVFIKTIVTTDLADVIAKHYGVKTINVLTGFKYIGEQIGLLEKQGKEDSYILGFEESYGYLSGTYVRDKDAVDGVLMICEMFAYYKTKGISLLDKLDELYARFGYYRNSLYSYEFEGSAGFARMRDIMSSFRKGLSDIGGYKVEKCVDYSLGIDGLPSSDVIKFYLEGGSSVVVRPSGTEPKLKTYISVKGSDRVSAAAAEKRINDFLKNCFV